MLIPPSEFIALSAMPGSVFSEPIPIFSNLAPKPKVFSTDEYTPVCASLPDSPECIPVYLNLAAASKTSSDSRCVSIHPDLVAKPTKDIASALMPTLPLEKVLFPRQEYFITIPIVLLEDALSPEQESNEDATSVLSEIIDNVDVQSDEKLITDQEPEDIRLPSLESGKFELSDIIRIIRSMPPMTCDKPFTAVKGDPIGTVENQNSESYLSKGYYSNVLRGTSGNNAVRQGCG